MNGLLLSTQLVLLAGMAYVIDDALRERMIAVGDRAPEFAIRMDNGQSLGPTGFGGKLLVLNFWASWCAPCMREMPSLHRLAQASRGQGVVVAAISVDADARAYRRTLQRLAPAFLTAHDREARLSASFGTFAWPETYIIDSSGRVRRKYIAERDWMDPEFLAELRALSGGLR